MFFYVARLLKCNKIVLAGIIKLQYWCQWKERWQNIGDTQTYVDLNALFSCGGNIFKDRSPQRPVMGFELSDKISQDGRNDNK